MAFDSLTDDAISTALNANDNSTVKKLTTEPEESLVDWERVRKDEGYNPNLYVIPPPKEGVSEKEKSGVTMLGGIDLGQGTKDKVYNIINDLGIPEEESRFFKKAVDKVSGLKGPAARAAYSSLDLELLTEVSLFLDAYGSNIQNAYNKNEEPKIEKSYNTVAGATGIQFKELPQEWRTAVASAHRQYGAATMSGYNFYKEIAKGDFSAAIDNLNNWGDQTPGYADSINNRYARYGTELTIPDW